MESHLSQALKGISFYKMEKVPYDILFYRQSLKNDCLIEDKLYRAPFSLGKRALFPNAVKWEFNSDPEGRILFYLSDSIRKSNEINFRKVVLTVPHQDCLIERSKKRRFRFSGIFLLSILLPIWIIQMRGRGLTLIEKYQVLKVLFDLFYIQKYFKKIDIEKYNLLVCYYDSIPHECLLNLMFKKKGIKTATLQHGQFNAWRENTFVNCGLEFYASPSDYQLCWNKFAQSEAIKCGWPLDRLPIVGIMSSIGRKFERCVKPHNGIFGVVLSHPSWQFENYEMIRAANSLANRFNLRYYLKLHPNYAEDYFKDAIEKEYYLGNVAKGIDTNSYVNMVDFSIVGSSSYFVELVYTFHDILRYSTLLPSDKYRDISVGSVFHKADEIISCYEHLSDCSKTPLFDYLCESDDAFSLYRDFFISFI